MNKYFFCFAVLFCLSASAVAFAKCKFGNGPVCAMPGRCQLIDVVDESHLPKECKTGVTFANRCAAQKEQASYIHEGSCRKLGDTAIKESFDFGRESGCEIPKISAQEAFKIARKAGLTVPKADTVHAEYTSGGNWTQSPFSSCMWTVRAIDGRQCKGDALGRCGDVVFVEAATHKTFLSREKDRIEYAERTKGQQNPGGELVASPNKGKSPLEVSVSFPKHWQELAARLCQSRDPNRGDERTLTIDWGDGTMTDSTGDKLPCPIHRYAIKGIYKITAKFETRSNLNEQYHSLLWRESATVVLRFYWGLRPRS